VVSLSIDGGKRHAFGEGDGILGTERGVRQTSSRIAEEERKVIYACALAPEESRRCVNRTSRNFILTADHESRRCQCRASHHLSHPHAALNSLSSIGIPTAIPRSSVASSRRTPYPSMPGRRTLGTFISRNFCASSPNCVPGIPESAGRNCKVRLSGRPVGGAALGPGRDE
jgi:hypothetical protein